MKDLKEAIREFDQRDAERVREVNTSAFYSGHISLEMRVNLYEARLNDTLQLIAWMVDHITALEKANAPVAIDTSENARSEQGS